MNSRSNVILIGATGHIGSWVHRYLVEEGYFVTACARNEVLLPPLLAKHTSWQILDIKNIESVKRAFASRTHEAFIHLASEKFVPNAESNPDAAIEINVCGTANVLAAAAGAGVKNGVFASSWAVYSPHDEIGKKYKEENNINPTTVYGITKKIGEELCNAYIRTNTIPNLTIFRLFNTVGERAHENAKSQAGFFKYVSDAVKLNKTVTIAGKDFSTADGTCIRDFVDVRDVASAFIKAITLNGSHIINIGSGQAHSLQEVLAAFELEGGSAIEPVVTSSRHNDPPYVEADITKAAKLLNFIPKYTMRDMVKSSLKS